MNRVSRLLVISAIAVLSSAHVGSPEVFYEGTAGPYKVHIRVYPPTVVPGVAWVFVRTAEPDLTSISIRPVFWRAGSAGAPSGDSLVAVAGEPGMYSGKIWLMSHGAYSVYVDVTGARGRHTAIVPVMARATARLGLDTRLAGVLVALGLLLLAGMVAIVRAGASDSLVDPGLVPDQRARRRGRLGALIAVPVLAIAVLGGARWWKAEDASYQDTMYRPLVANAIVVTRPVPTLRLTIVDTNSQRLLTAPLMADHGKLMHLFLVKESSMSAFAHLHPARGDHIFVSALPPIPAGRYLVFGDIILETGAEYTVSTTVEVPPPAGNAPSDPDDSWIADAAGVPARGGARAHLTSALDLQWDGPDSITATRDVDLRFSVRNQAGALEPIQPYMGMAAHAVVLRGDASVFIHLHPMGTVSMASQQAFAQRDRGDTLADGRLRTGEPMTMPASDVSLDGSFSFPYAFPKPGRYRLWVQVRIGMRVETADYAVTVR